MPLLFLYGSLQQGFANEHVNGGVRRAGSYQTRMLLPMFLLGEGNVPCVIHSPGTGHHVIGEVYEVDEPSLASMDRLERLGAPGGYERVAIEVHSTAATDSETLTVFAYVKTESQVPAGIPRIGPLAEYTQEHARHFKW